MCSRLAASPITARTTMTGMSRAGARLSRRSAGPSTDPGSVIRASGTASRICLDEEYCAEHRLLSVEGAAVTTAVAYVLDARRVSLAFRSSPVVVSES
jgi:hypothetical protein